MSGEDAGKTVAIVLGSVAGAAAAGHAAKKYKDYRARARSRSNTRFPAHPDSRVRGGNGDHALHSLRVPSSVHYPDDARR